MATAQDAVSLTIDGRPVTVPAGTSIYHAAAELGIDIPTLCYHPNIAASANCRLCLVEQVADAARRPPCRRRLAQQRNQAAVSLPSAGGTGPDAIHRQRRRPAVPQGFVEGACFPAST